jgi:hypothetical protein
MLMVRLQVHLRPDIHAVLTDRAHKEGVSAAELVRQGIELRLACAASAPAPEAQDRP